MMSSFSFDIRMSMWVLPPWFYDDGNVAFEHVCDGGLAMSVLDQ